MRRLLIGTALAGGAAFALRRLVRKDRKLPGHCGETMCGETMRDHCCEMVDGGQPH